MGKPTVNQIRNLPEPVEALDGERHYFSGNMGGLFFGFLAARAMPDGALAVAMQFGYDYVQVMRLYVRDMQHQLTTPAFDFDSPTLHALRGIGWNRPRHEVNMDFHVGDIVAMSRKEYDERTFHQQIPQYADVGPMETRLIEPPK